MVIIYAHIRSHMAYTICEFEEYTHCNFGMAGMRPFSLLKSTSFIQTVEWYVRNIELVAVNDVAIAKCMVFDMLCYIVEHKVCLQLVVLSAFQQALREKLTVLLESVLFTKLERKYLREYRWIIFD